MSQSIDLQGLLHHLIRYLKDGLPRYYASIIHEYGDWPERLSSLLPGLLYLGQIRYVTCHYHDVVLHMNPNLSHYLSLYTRH